MVLRVNFKKQFRCLVRGRSQIDFVTRDVIWTFRGGGGLGVDVKEISFYIVLCFNILCFLS